MRDLNIIVAVDECGGFGKEGKIPWNFREDFKHFQRTTAGSVCVMGRKTYDDMYEMAMKVERDITGGILPKRESYVISRNEEFVPVGATRISGLRELEFILNSDDARDVFVLGGEKIFIESLPWVKKVYMTIVKGNYNCDKFFPLPYIATKFTITEGKDTDDLYFVEYIRK